MNFYYYKGDWSIGKKLVAIIVADTILVADFIFENKTNISAKSINISCTFKQIVHSLVDNSL